MMTKEEVSKILKLLIIFGRVLDNMKPEPDFEDQYDRIGVEAEIEEAIKFCRDELNRKESTIEEIKCPECGGKMISRSGQYGKFWGCAKFPECKGTRDSLGRSKQDRAKEKESGNRESGNRRWTIE